MEGDQDIRRLEIAMDNALLMGVLDGLAYLDEQLEPLAGAEPLLVAVLGDRHTANQLHHKIRTSLLRGTAIEDLGDMRMLHQRQGLTLRLEAGDDFWYPCQA